MKKLKIFLNVIIYCLISLTIILSINETYHVIKDDSTKEIKTHNESEGELEKISRLLTNSMKKLGKLSCRVSVNDVSDNGGWCANISGLNSTVHYFDAGLARELGQVLSGKKVVSFGEGPGSYKSYLENQSLVSSYDGFDGAPFVEETTNNRVSFIDLTVPIYHLGEYDWVVSIEVAEHIPPQFESVYLDNLVRHAKEGIIISWAHPGQLGQSHVNNRPTEYVKKQMKSRGFSYDGATTSRLRRSTFAHWIRANINVFVRRIRNKRILIF